ncbi:hypothetical protein P389DRAFT_188413 [Cystobasidium minutum MCA 4210]|uniref:uncharacterized protein n=1 Tax=Cystobasidium minutum MCA 4210 TaxID=1397322 RepID=UPI0034CF260D|eukprot:jgi/Rhomi1/188413/estExt_fgenesh1_pg.C_2_t20262
MASVQNEVIELSFLRCKAQDILDDYRAFIKHILDGFASPSRPPWVPSRLFPLGAISICVRETEVHDRPASLLLDASTLSNGAFRGEGKFKKKGSRTEVVLPSWTMEAPVLQLALLWIYMKEQGCREQKCIGSAIGRLRCGVGGEKFLACLRLKRGRYSAVRGKHIKQLKRPLGQMWYTSTRSEQFGSRYEQDIRAEEDRKTVHQGKPKAQLEGRPEKSSQVPKIGKQGLKLFKALSWIVVRSKSEE